MYTNSPAASLTLMGISADGRYTAIADFGCETVLVADVRTRWVLGPIAGLEGARRREDPPGQPHRRHPAARRVPRRVGRHGERARDALARLAGWRGR
jgi:hypothetical protein